MTRCLCRRQPRPVRRSNTHVNLNEPVASACSIQRHSVHVKPACLHHELVAKDLKRTTQSFSSSVSAGNDEGADDGEDEIAPATAPAPAPQAARLQVGRRAVQIHESLSHLPARGLHTMQQLCCPSPLGRSSTMRLRARIL